MRQREMKYGRWLSATLLLLLTMPLAAQTPSVTDQNRTPVYGPTTGSAPATDSGRLPVMQSAGTGAGGIGIQSFPSPTASAANIQQQYIPSRPTLSPYLNLVR